MRQSHIKPTTQHRRMVIFFRPDLYSNTRLNSFPLEYDIAKYFIIDYTNNSLAFEVNSYVSTASNILTTLITRMGKPRRESATGN